MKPRDTNISPDRTSRIAGIGITVALHVTVIFALLQFQPLRAALVEAAPIMVSLITPQPQVEKPHIIPKPLPVKRAIRPPQPQSEPLVALAPEASQPAAATLEAPPAPPAIAPPVVAAPRPGPMAIAPSPVITQPRFDAAYLNNPPPQYPAVSRRMGEQGKVMLRVFVDANGNAEKVELRASSGSIRLDASALDCVKGWRFVPAREGDRTIAAWVVVPITFTLES